MTLVDAETGEIMPFADATLEECEAVIERGLSSFVEVGNALVAIREGHKYRKTHKTFEAYCDQRWGLARNRAYQLIDAAEVTEVLSTMVDTPVPTNERQARALAPLKSDPAAMADAMRTASRVANGNPTARDVADAVREHKPLERTTVTPNFKPGTVQPEAKARLAEPRAARRSPITDAAMSAGFDLQKSVERVQRIVADDRFSANKEEVAARLRSHLKTTVEVCQDLLDLLNHQPQEK
ncbi:MAG: hypothetical protein KA129_06430 [Microthrixaceae bacterium]|nr:hypothetical protein [Microthrixaceae bacterium]